MKTSITKRFIESLPVPKSGAARYWDQAVRGLGIKVEPTGAKTFYWSRKARGRRVWKTIGEWPAMTIDDARAQASKHNTTLAEWKKAGFHGVDPFGHPTALTFDALVNEYVDRHLKHQAKDAAAAEKALRWRIGKYLSGWGARPVSDIQHDDIRALHRRIGAGHQRTANLVVKDVRTLFNFAARERLWKGENPAAGIKFYFEPSRERFLQPSELPQFFAALRRSPSQDLQDFVALALWTAARRSDVLSMRWQDVSIDDNVWRVPNPKSRHAYSVPLSSESVTVLKQRLASRTFESPFVFPSHGKTGHVVDLKKQWKALLVDAGLYSDDRAVRLRVHDMRRTHGAYMASGGASMPMIAKALGHQPGSPATAVYSRLNLDPVRQAMQLATAAIRAAAQKKPPAARKPKLLSAPAKKVSRA